MKYNSEFSKRNSKLPFKQKSPKAEKSNGNISPTMSPTKKPKNKSSAADSSKLKSNGYAKCNSISPANGKLKNKKAGAVSSNTLKSPNSSYRAKSLGAKAPRNQNPGPADTAYREQSNGSKLSPSKMVRRLSACSEEFQSPSKHMPVYDDTRKYLDIVIEGELSRLNVCDRIDIVTLEELVKQAASDSPIKESSSQTPRQQQKRKVELTELIAPPVNAEPMKRLNEAVVKVLSGFVSHVKTDQEWQRSRSEGYYRYVEKSAEELDEDIEYDMDEEDFAWLELYNEHRATQKRDSVSEEAFEFVIDRLEKEAHYVDQAQTTSKQKGASGMSEVTGGENDEDAVCSICLDDECQNLNAILFCDRCNLAVHQDCYGVPYVPEGEWLCRKCQRSPTQTIHCCLCPRTDGAMKQTDDGRWCHVLCALWIPEVGFGSVESLEPITKIDKVPSARRKLACSICKKRECGAGIQCMKKNCYTAFHVSCAQQIGIYMKIEPVHDNEGAMVNVHKTILCNAHRPPDSKPFEPMIDNSIDSDPEHPTIENKTKGSVKVKVKNNRLDFGGINKNKKGAGKKGLGKGSEASAKDNVAIPLERMVEIADALVMKDRYEIVGTVRNYWKLKRSSRVGMALLRRLQTATNSITCDVKEVVTGAVGTEKEDSTSGLVTLRRLRNEMEKVRLLLELIRKREKLKREMKVASRSRSRIIRKREKLKREMKVASWSRSRIIRKREKLKREMAQHRVQIVQLKLTPCSSILYETLDQLQSKDEGDVFAQPVNIREVPTYLNVIKKPMDFSTMRRKIDNNEYCDLRDLEKDFNLMIKNCIKFNTRDTAYYRFAVRLRKKGHKILAAAKVLEGGSRADPSANGGTETDTSVAASTIKNLLSSPVVLQSMDDSSDEDLESPKKKKIFKKVLQVKNKTVNEKRFKKAPISKLPELSKISKAKISPKSPSKKNSAFERGKRPMHGNSYKSWIKNKRKKLRMDSSTDAENTPVQENTSESIKRSGSKSSKSTPKRKHSIESDAKPSVKSTDAKPSVKSSDAKPSVKSKPTPASDLLSSKKHEKQERGKKRTRSLENNTLPSTPSKGQSPLTKRRKLSVSDEKIKEKKSPVGLRSTRTSGSFDSPPAFSSSGAAPKKRSTSSTELPRTASTSDEDDGPTTLQSSSPDESPRGVKGRRSSTSLKSNSPERLGKTDSNKKHSVAKSISKKLKIKKKRSDSIDDKVSKSKAADKTKAVGKRRRSDDSSDSVRNQRSDSVNSSPANDEIKRSAISDGKSLHSKRNKDKISESVSESAADTDYNPEDAPPVLSRCPSPLDDDDEEEILHPIIERYDSVELNDPDAPPPATPPVLVKSDDESAMEQMTSRDECSPVPPQLLEPPVITGECSPAPPQLIEQLVITGESSPAPPQLMEQPVTGDCSPVPPQLMEQTVITSKRSPAPPHLTEQPVITGECCEIPPILTEEITTTVECSGKPRLRESPRIINECSPRPPHLTEELVTTEETSVNPQLLTEQLVANEEVSEFTSPVAVEEEVSSGECSIDSSLVVEQSASGDHFLKSPPLTEQPATIDEGSAVASPLTDQPAKTDQCPLTSESSETSIESSECQDNPKNSSDQPVKSDECVESSAQVVIETVPSDDCTEDTFVTVEVPEASDSINNEPVTEQVDSSAVDCSESTELSNLTDENTKNSVELTERLTACQDENLPQVSEPLAADSELLEDIAHSEQPVLSIVEDPPELLDGTLCIDNAPNDNSAGSDAEVTNQCDISTVIENIENPPELLKQSECKELPSRENKTEPPVLRKSCDELPEQILINLEDSQLNQNSVDNNTSGTLEIADVNNASNSSCSDADECAPPTLLAYSASDNTSDSLVKLSGAASGEQIANCPAALSPNVMESSDSSCTCDSSQADNDTSRQAESNCVEVKLTSASARKRSGLFESFSAVLSGGGSIPEADSSYGSANSDSEQSRSKCNSPDYRQKVDCVLSRSSSLMAGSDCQTST